jgi:hypothetical protein
VCDPRGMEYKDIVEIAVEAIDWKTHADEWLHRVGRCMTGVDGYAVTGHRYDMTTEPFIEVTSTMADGSAHDTQFLVLPLDDGVLIASGTREGDQPSEAASEAWARAARCATEGLGTAGTSFAWTAVLGPPPIRMGGTEVAINNEATVGPFHISSAGRGLREVLPPQAPTFSSSIGGSVSWPILVEGQHEGYDWSAAGRKAAFELHRLAGMLSVALSDCIVEREAPAPREWGVRQVPDQLSWLSRRVADARRTGTLVDVGSHRRIDRPPRRLRIRRGVQSSVQAHPRHLANAVARGS